MKNNKFGKRFGASLRVGELTTMCWPRFSNQQWPWESPPLCNAGPHPGTTWSYKAGEIIHQLIEQPGHAGYAAPGSCTIWRPETQNSAFLRYPLHGRTKTPPHQSKGPQKFKTPLQVPVFPGAVCCVVIPVVKKTIRLNFIPLSPGLPQD
ncbi:hypothetical protein TNIN_219331 [Trichonephila inaurata madagascariensis]|uniref:Uncharacterized protein n=1 Tax=Trichonephila inaurata madagascariensis TaxID=2747483 RepID=A0A8X6YK14_9ARAC|nr:hypothetical protein TNIN_219331 [Trichonephila inaurata madagascariensis]